MQIGPLDLPDELLTALEEKRLVIFAGAGVSMGSPASLPSFRELVKGIVGRALEKDEVGQMDRVLGRAKEKGVPVHKLAAEQLEVSDSRYNSLHENLVRLFPNGAELRIVTTNFDRHFEGAIEARQMPNEVEVYHAPALPRGSAFSGLVHLHGTLGRNLEDLVLTDADFGRAYLSEGWAGRFIVDLFREYTVLFVGYSYGDVVMSYLTRGLAPTAGRRRFALTEAGNRDHWDLLGIQPIEYDNPTGDHPALAEGLAQWVTLEGRGFLDWSQRLQTLVGREPRALAPDEHGELEFCLKNPKRAKLFYEYAKDPSWLEWAEKRGRLQPLFSAGGEGDQESIRELANWFCEDPLGERGKIALQIALGKTRLISAALAITASLQVHSALAKSKNFELAHAHRTAAWATLLIDRTTPYTPPANLGFWLEHIPVQDYTSTVVRILDYLMRCRPVFSKATFSYQERAIDLELRTVGIADHLDHHWNTLRLQIGVLAWPLVPVLTEVFAARWRWFVSMEATKPISDSWGWNQPWVERPASAARVNQAPHGQTATCLLAIGKDVLDELLAHSPKKAIAVIDQWLAADAPQLIQLGLYGLAKSPHLKAAAKIKRLLAGHLPARMPFKVEAFRVLQGAYPQLSSRQRERFLKRGKQLYTKHLAAKNDSPNHPAAAYEFFNLLTWLKQTTTDDPLIDHEIKTVKLSYPEFEPRDAPDLDIVIGELTPVRHASLLGRHEITQLSFPLWLEALETSRQRSRAAGFTVDYVQSFLEETAQAASEDLEWGHSFALKMIGSNISDQELWDRFLNAWAARPFTPAEWEKALDLLSQPWLMKNQTRGVTEVVTARTKQKAPDATKEMLLGGLLLVEKILPHAEEIGLTILSETHDWFLQSLNHPGGRLADFVVVTTGELLPENRYQGCGIPETCKPLLNAFVDGTGTASAMGRVMLATRVHYLLSVDPEWARARLLPFFDWHRDLHEATRAWQGLLSMGRPSAGLLEALAPATAQLTEYLSLLGDQREHYGKFMARAAFSSPADPFSKDWFQSFLDSANDDDRTYFTWDLDRLIERLDPTKKVALWNAWLNHYFEHRAKFPPKPGGKELTALLAFAFHLPDQLAEVVQRIENLPGLGVTDDRLIWKLREGELAGSDPDILARLLLTMLKRRIKVDPGHLSDLHRVIINLIAEGAQSRLIKELIEKYLEHGGGSEHQVLTAALQKREAAMQTTATTPTESPS